ncbi:MAG: response regulator [Phycisphaerae bacterium]|nr:response regulator [Phycisphaerae bacterium]
MRARTILLVDDETPIRLLVGNRLRSVGYTVLEAADGEQALDMARDERPDLIVTDLQMPHMSGLEFLVRLRAEPGLAPIPAIMLTSRGYVLAPEQLELAGVKTMLSKPFSIRAVVEKIQSILAPNTGGAEQAA